MFRFLLNLLSHKIIYVPTCEVFLNYMITAIPEETLKSLKTEQDKARTFVLFHTVQGRWKTDRFTNNQVRHVFSRV